MRRARTITRAPFASTLVGADGARDIVGGEIDARRSRDG
jgi:hypothetical protein